MPYSSVFLSHRLRVSLRAPAPRAAALSADDQDRAARFGQCEHDRVLVRRLDARDRAALVSASCATSGSDARRSSGEVRVGDVRVGAALDRVDHVGRGHFAVDRRAEVHARADVDRDRLAAVGDAAVGASSGSSVARSGSDVGRVRLVGVQRPLRGVDRRRSRCAK